VNAEIATLPPRTNWVKTTPEFQKIHKVASGMHAYSAKEISSGAWKGHGANSPPQAAGSQPVDFKPNGQWTTLDGARFSVQYPENWQAQEKAGAGATIAPPNGVAATANDSAAVIYGVIIDDFQPQQGADLGAATQQLIASIQQGNTGMKAVTGVDPIRVNQHDARSVEFLNKGDSPGGGTERDWLVTVVRDDGSLSYLVFVAPQQDFETLRPAFEQVLRTFKVKG
jgi:hypothetical protein